MQITIPDFSKARILVVGDLMLDRYWHGPTSRISPEAPVPVVKVEETEERAGGAGNVALNIASLGAQVVLIGLTGKDEAAQVLRQRLQALNVDCRFVQLEECTTITKLRILSRHQQLIRLDFEDGFSDDHAHRIAESFEQALSDCEVVVFSDYQKGTLGQIQQMIQQAREQGKKIVIDPKGDDFQRYQGASILTPNFSEFEAIAGSCKHEQDVVRKAQALRQKLELEALLITRSEKGMTLVQKGTKAVSMPTSAREVYDVTGAGDTVVATLAAALATSMKMLDAVKLANLAASIVVGKVGTASANVSELRQAMRQFNQLEQGIVSEAQLKKLIQSAKAHGEKIILTNGCFDILHAGHVTYLQQAKKLGDRLIVAVNDDASVRRLKGAERPVNSLQQRMLVLASLSCVDWVVPFYEDTPRRLICELLPSALVKGGDNEVDKIPGGDCVKKAGGEVLVMDYVDNCSTTGLIRAIRAADATVEHKN